MVLYYNTMMRGGAVVARQAHNLKAVGSIPAPATNDYYNRLKSRFFVLKFPNLHHFLHLEKRW